jgi:hypothetical protein
MNILVGGMNPLLPGAIEKMKNDIDDQRKRVKGARGESDVYAPPRSPVNCKSFDSQRGQDYLGDLVSSGAIYHYMDDPQNNYRYAFGKLTCHLESQSSGGSAQKIKGAYSDIFVGVVSVAMMGSGWAIKGVTAIRGAAAAAEAANAAQKLYSAGKMAQSTMRLVTYGEKMLEVAADSKKLEAFLKYTKLGLSTVNLGASATYVKKTYADCVANHDARLSFKYKTCRDTDVVQSGDLANVLKNELDDKACATNLALSALTLITTAMDGAALLKRAGGGRLPGSKPSTLPEEEPRTPANEEPGSQKTVPTAESSLSKARIVKNIKIPPTSKIPMADYIADLKKVFGDNAVEQIGADGIRISATDTGQFGKVTKLLRALEKGDLEEARGLMSSLATEKELREMTPEELLKNCTKRTYDKSHTGFATREFYTHTAPDSHMSYSFGYDEEGKLINVEIVSKQKFKIGQGKEPIQVYKRWDLDKIVTRGNGAPLDPNQLWAKGKIPIVEGGNCLNCHNTGIIRDILKDGGANPSGFEHPKAVQKMDQGLYSTEKLKKAINCGLTMGYFNNSCF